jgi:hypothetical protein
MALAIVLCAVVVAGQARANATQPATVADAAKVLDLASFPLMDGVKIDGPRRLASLSYPAKGDSRGAYAFQKKALETKGWKELKDGYLSDMACNGVFGKAGYLVSVSTSPAYGPEAAGMVQVQLTNHGNIDIGKLPVPPGAKPLYSFPVSKSYATETPAEETGKALRKLLTQAGWEPYGTAGDTQFFKQNAVRISVTSVKAPAQSGKTMIQFSSELMSADLPAPAEALRTSYADVTKAVSLDVDMTPEQLVSFYKDALGKAGWKPTTEQLIKDGFEDMLIFGNPAKEILTLKMHTVDGKLRANLDHMTAAEFAEIVRLAKAAEEKLKRPPETACSRRSRFPREPRMSNDRRMKSPSNSAPASAETPSERSEPT